MNNFKLVLVFLKISGMLLLLVQVQSSKIEIPVFKPLDPSFEDVVTEIPGFGTGTEITTQSISSQSQEETSTTATPNGICGDGDICTEETVGIAPAFADFHANIPEKYEYTLLGQEVIFNDNFTFHLNPYLYGNLSPEEQKRKLQQLFSTGKSNHDRHMGRLNGSIEEDEKYENEVQNQNRNLRRGKRFFCTFPCGLVNCFFGCPLLLPGVGCCPGLCTPWC